MYCLLGRTTMSSHHRRQSLVVEWKRNLMAHGEAREEKWRGKRRMEWVASSPALYRSTVCPALLPLIRTPRLPAADWTDTPADINGLVRFAGRPNMVSARVPSHSVFTLPITLVPRMRYIHLLQRIVTCSKYTNTDRVVYKQLQKKKKLSNTESVT